MTIPSRHLSLRRQLSESESSGKGTDLPPFPDNSQGGVGRRAARSPVPRPSIPGCLQSLRDPHRRPGCSCPGTGKQGQLGTQPPPAAACCRLSWWTPTGHSQGAGLWAGNTFCPRDSVTSFWPSVKGKNAVTGNRSLGLANLLTVLGSLTDSQHFHRYQRSRMTSSVFGKKESREGTGGGTRPANRMVSSSPCRTLGIGGGCHSNFTKWKEDRRCLPEQGSQS